jgi:glycosyltransferase involved in cell wall biosynthesis
MSAPRKRTFLSPGRAARELGRLVATRGGAAASRLAQNLVRRGPHGAPIAAADAGRTVLLFFEDVEHDRFVKGDRHLRRAARRLYHATTSGQRVSGFEIAFQLLVTALERAGCRVVINNERLARRHPTHPVGICGYPHVLDRWALPNPAVLGPGLFDHPTQAPRLMDDPRFRSYLVPCEWMREMFAALYGDATRVWFAGMDLERVPDYRDQPKDIDLLVYDKIRWNRDVLVPGILEPVLAEAARRGLRVERLPYGGYQPADYHQLLQRSRGMLFLCEHETQGLAYQEAMTANVPILAWDPELWLDPHRASYTSEPIVASSVPYFSSACGDRFRDVAEFPDALTRFLRDLPTYEPRRYVREHLSLERSAAQYLDAYVDAGR